jgi:transcriptional regulator of arginine metabolism
MLLGSILVQVTLSARERRQRAILELVALHRPRSQAELGRLLTALGFEVNQATLSRDLRQLGLRKGPQGYETPDGSSGRIDLRDPLARAVVTWLGEVRRAQQILVLKTPPGGAQPLGVALDNSPPEGLIGTVAGDDTVLAVCADPLAADRVADLLEYLLGNT